MSKLEVENSFINYFDKETEIYKGMKKIDDDLGGTTPLNIILKFPSNSKTIDNKEDEFDEWEEDQKNNEDKSKYWFTRDKMDKIINPCLRLVRFCLLVLFKRAEDLNNKE